MRELTGNCTSLAAKWQMAFSALRYDSIWPRKRCKINKFAAFWPHLAHFNCICRKNRKPWQIRLTSLLGLLHICIGSNASSACHQGGNVGLLVVAAKVLRKGSRGEDSNIVTPMGICVQRHHCGAHVQWVLGVLHCNVLATIRFGEGALITGSIGIGENAVGYIVVGQLVSQSSDGFFAVLRDIEGMRFSYVRNTDIYS